MNQRRKVLKSFGISVPAVWTATVVQTVLLPVHAQTSQQDAASSSEGCSALIIPGLTVSCPVGDGSGTTVNRTDYRIDDSGSCPVLNQTTGSETPDSDDVFQVYVRTCESCNNENSSEVRIELLTNGPTRTYVMRCDASDGSLTNSNLDFESSSGVTYEADITVTGTIDGDGNFLTLSDITLTPIP